MSGSEQVSAQRRVELWIAEAHDQVIAATLASGCHS